jgi:hypothetical protein
VVLFDAPTAEPAAPRDYRTWYPRRPEKMANHQETNRRAAGMAGADASAKRLPDSELIQTFECAESSAESPGPSHLSSASPSTVSHSMPWQTVKVCGLSMNQHAGASPGRCSNVRISRMSRS